jgi:aryl-alcohol dehydrogenase-like predicted oxidoreductase
MENLVKRQLMECGGIGLGAMELAINANRPGIMESQNLIESLVEEHALSFIDTADCYCWGEEDFGYCERLLSPFVHNENVLIASKVGMRREGTAWIKSGSPEYLRSACELSLKNLGVEAIDLCQFHAPDPNVPLLESIGELSRLRQEGKIRALGVCNVNLEQLRAIIASTEIVSVQNPLSLLFYESAKDNSFLEYCVENGIAFIAFAPLGGHRNPYVLPTVSKELNAVAESLVLSTYQLALLFLKSLSSTMIAIPGSISKEHIIENLSVRNMSLSDEVKTHLTALAS